jgi:acyl carrier protein
VPKLPFNANGKVDERVLKEWVVSSAEDVCSHSNLSENEVLIAKIWSKVLNCSEANVGKESNFFELGGDSLGFLKMLASLEALIKRDSDISKLGENVSLIVKNPVLASVASFVQRINDGDLSQTRIV